MVMRKAKKIKGKGISLPDKQVTKYLGEKPYKDLGVLETDRIKIDKMKDIRSRKSTINE